MNRRILAASMVMALAISAAPALHALPLEHIPAPANAPKVKTVSFSLRNDGATSVTVMAGTTLLTLAPGKTSDAKVAVGDKIVVQDGSATLAAGTLIAVVSTTLSGSTVTFR